MQKDYLGQGGWGGGGGAPQNPCSISYMLNSRNKFFNPYF